MSLKRRTQSFSSSTLVTSYKLQLQGILNLLMLQPQGINPLILQVPGALLSLTIASAAAATTTLSNISERQCCQLGNLKMYQQETFKIVPDFK